MRIWSTVAVWKKAGIRYHVIKIDIDDIERRQLTKLFKNFPYPSLLSTYPYYTGYCTFKRRPLKEPGYQGILDWVPIHGGITYAKPTRWGYTYGFDTAHVGDEGNAELRDPKWLIAECEKMARSILTAIKYEKLYHRHPKKAALALHKDLGEPDFEPSIGALVSSVCGLHDHKRHVMLRRAKKITPQPFETPVKSR